MSEKSNTATDTTWLIAFVSMVTMAQEGCIIGILCNYSDRSTTLGHMIANALIKGRARLEEPGTKTM
uniref:Uncharacterized protein n=1 Tax=Timema poppense TaxID=170557 RepID=A0A7R9H522_TIMPO|nr:unnamed protein product [Timema poppensis]